AQALGAIAVRRDRLHLGSSRPRRSGSPSRGHFAPGESVLRRRRTSWVALVGAEDFVPAAGVLAARRVGGALRVGGPLVGGGALLARALRRLDPTRPAA